MHSAEIFVWFSLMGSSMMWVSWGRMVVFPFWFLFECVDDVCSSVDGHDGCDNEVSYGCCEWDGWA